MGRSGVKKGREYAILTMRLVKPLLASLLVSINELKD
jgi:hypothetical protein